LIFGPFGPIDPVNDLIREEGLHAIEAAAQRTLGDQLSIPGTEAVQVNDCGVNAH
jgi:hypothetical protein